MGVAGGRFVGLGADAEPPAPLSMAARSWSASLNGTLSVFTAKSMSALTSTPVSVTNIPRAFALVVAMIGVAAHKGMPRRRPPICQDRTPRDRLRLFAKTFTPFNCTTNVARMKAGC